MMMLYNFHTNATYYKQNVNLLVTLGTLARFSNTGKLNYFTVKMYSLITPLLERLKLFIAFSKNDPYTRFIQFWCQYSEFFCVPGIGIIAGR